MEVLRRQEDSLQSVRAWEREESLGIFKLGQLPSSEPQWLRGLLDPVVDTVHRLILGTGSCMTDEA